VGSICPAGHERVKVMQKWHVAFSENSEQETSHTNITRRTECFGMLCRAVHQYLSKLLRKAVLGDETVIILSKIEFCSYYIAPFCIPVFLLHLFGTSVCLV
jgi:hypothetical protein